MAKLTYDMSGLEGLAPRFFGDVNDSSATPNKRILASERQIVGGFGNPIRNYGYMSPANKTVQEITGAVANAFSCTQSDITSEDAWFGEAGTQIWALNSSADTSLASQVTVAGATFTDLEIYQVNGVKKLFYAYQAAGGGNIGIATIPFASNDDDWLSAAASGGFNTGATNDVFMVVSDNGFMYVFDGDSVHKIDGTTNGGTNGTASANVLNFPVTFTITDAVDFRGNMYIAVQGSSLQGTAVQASINSGVIGVYIWDRKTTVINTQDFIPIPRAREIRKLYIAPTGRLRAIVISGLRFTEILEFNGSVFVPIQQLPVNAFPKYRDSVSIVGDLVMWIGTNGIIYGHGSPVPGEKEGLFQLGDGADFTPGSSPVYGAILLYSGVGNDNIIRPALILSSSDGVPARYTRQWYIHGVAGVDQFSKQGDIYYAVKYLPQMSTVQNLELYCAVGVTTGTTTQATLKIYFNQSTTSFASKTITRDDIVKGYKRIEINKPFINSIQLEVEYPESIAASTNYDFFPSFAVVTYEPTKARG